MIRGYPLLAFFAAAGPAFGQAPIVVTGQGLGAGRGEEVYDLVVIDRQRLNHSPSYRLEDVLRDVPGFQLFRRSDSRSANPTSQGATLRALGGNASSRALVTLDGVPQTDPFGGWISWPAYDPRRLGRVRVSRGGGTGANGPGALAGTIELESAAADEQDGAAAGLAFGSRDTLEAFAAYGAPLGRGFVALSAAWAQGDGFVPVIAEQRGPVDRPSPYRQGSLALRAVTPVAAAVELQANLAAFTDARERGTAFSEIETRGADASLRLVGRGPLPFALLAYVQSRDFANRFAAAGAGRSLSTPTLDQVSVPSTGLGARFEIRPVAGRFELRLGADGRETEGRTQELFAFVDGAPTRGRVAGGRTRNVGGFAEAGWQAGALIFSAGGRVDRWRIEDGELRERLLAGGAALTDMRFADRGGWEASGRAGAGWRASGRLSLRAAAYRGWRLPTLNELYRPFRLGADATAANAALTPERLEGAEAGLELRPARGARIGVTAFVNRLGGAIANVTLGEGPGLFPGVGFVAAGGQFRQRRNVDSILSRGVEVDAALTAGRWRLAAGYSFADAEVEAGGEAAPLDGLRPAQTPRHSAAATLSWQGRRGAYAALSARFAGSQYEDDLNRQLIADALTFDAVALLPLGGRLALEARVENLTGARVVAGISGSGIVERASPRLFLIGIRFGG